MNWIRRKNSWIKVQDSYPPVAGLEANPGRSISVAVKDDKDNKGIAYFDYPNHRWNYYYQNKVKDVLLWQPLSENTSLYREMLDFNLRRLNVDRMRFSETSLGYVDVAYLESLGYIESQIDHNEIRIRLTDKGMIFRTEGGFKSQWERKSLDEKERYLQWKNWNATTISAYVSLGISLISAVVAVVALASK